MAVKLTDLRSWLGVLRDAALMRPHPAMVAAASDDKEIDGYLARLAALLFAGEWVVVRVDRSLLKGLVAASEPLRKLPGVVPPGGLAVLDGMVAARKVAAEESLLVPPYLINGAVEAAVLFGLVFLVLRTVRPAPPPARAAAGAVLSALVSASLYGVVVGWLMLRITEATGFLDKARAMQSAASDAELLAALGAFLESAWAFGLLGGLLGPLPVVAEAVVLLRALRAFGARRGLAWLGAVAAALLSNAAIPLMDAFGIRRFLYLLAAG